MLLSVCVLFSSSALFQLGIRAIDPDWHVEKPFRGLLREPGGLPAWRKDRCPNRWREPEIVEEELLKSIHIAATCDHS